MTSGSSIFNTAETHAEQLAWHQESWSSIELVVERVMIPSQYVEIDRPSQFQRTVIRYIETAGGQRLYDRRSFKGEEVVYRQTHYFDGRRGADVMWAEDDPEERQQQIVIHRHFGREDREVLTQRPKPLLWYWVDRDPLHEVLTQARKLGQNKVLGRVCDLFLFSETGHTGTWEQVYYLDAVTSTPLKVVVYKTPEDRLSEQPIIVWTAEEIGKFQGYPIVTKAVQRDFSAEGGKHSWTREFVVESIAFNKEYPSSTFWPDFGAGAFVFDNVKATAKRIPDGDQDEVLEEADQAADTETTATTAVAPAIRADPPKSWSFYATSATLGLGCAAILVSLWLWWRRG